MANNTTIAAPISWTPSVYWDGNDGMWNTFIVEAGTPPQRFRILPSTAGQETWLPNPEGCTSASPSDPGYCGYLRGTLPFNGVNSSGFQTNESSSWDLIGLYTLDAQELELGYTGNGLYGFDTVVLNGTNEAVNQAKQVVAGVADPDFWLGVFGLGPKSINFTTFRDPIENYMSTLVSSSQIPSLSWGYTAGAHYQDRAPASLTLGGYDTNRFEPSSITFAMNQDNSRPLQVVVQKLIASNTLQGGSVDLLSSATYHFIDSTLPHIWLPDDAIQAFVENFGLTYDNDTDLFLINDTMRQQLLIDSPTITFVLANSTTAGVTETQNIELPYAAFDLQASYPFYQNATNYFPIRRAANDSQYTIGRTFLQEAYLIADFERSNFTVAQVVFDNLEEQHLVVIQKPVASNGTSSPTTPTTKPTSLSGGVIAGIVIAAIAGVTLVVLAIWFFIRRRKRAHQALSTTDLDTSEKPPVFPTDDRKASELPNENAIAEAPAGAKATSELPSPPVASEVEGDLGKTRARAGMFEMGTPDSERFNGRGGPLAEAPGSDGARYELMGSEPTDSRSVYISSRPQPLE